MVGDVERLCCMAVRADVVASRDARHLGASFKIIHTPLFLNGLLPMFSLLYRFSASCIRSSAVLPDSCKWSTAAIHPTNFCTEAESPQKCWWSASSVCLLIAGRWEIAFVWMLRQKFWRVWSVPVVASCETCSHEQHSWQSSSDEKAVPRLRRGLSVMKKNKAEVEVVLFLRQNKTVLRFE